MIHQEKYDSLTKWQQALVDREVHKELRDDAVYRSLDRMRDFANVAVAEAADTIINYMRDETFDEVLTDSDFMESITTDEETRYQTKGNSRAY